MLKNQEFCFHESSIVQFKRIKDSILLELEDVDFGEKKSRVLITCINVNKIETDAKEMGSDYMITDDGEVLTLNFLGHRAELIVQWHDHVAHSHEIKFYYIYCMQIDLATLSK